MKSFTCLLPSLFILSAMACSSPATKVNALSSEEENTPVIAPISLYDTIPGKYISNLVLTEINGTKVSYTSGRSTCYFSYKANPAEVLRMVASLPFKPDHTLSDTLSRKMNFPFSLSGKKILPEAEILAAPFFWEINPLEFDYYECLKSPVRHTLLIHKTSGTILHRMEYTS
ncbi:MAG: hypothetical protein JNM57_02515 [Cyclobacteriaceae bacterium]|nr:hypothetical protein [Cyclobacteriaceae bacterium]